MAANFLKSLIGDREQRKEDSVSRTKNRILDKELSILREKNRYLKERRAVLAEEVKKADDPKRLREIANELKGIERSRMKASKEMREQVGYAKTGSGFSSIMMSMLRGAVKGMNKFSEVSATSARSLQTIGAQAGGITNQADQWPKLVGRTNVSVKTYMDLLRASHGEVTGISSSFAQVGISQEKAFLQGEGAVKGLVGTALQLNRIYGVDLAQSTQMITNLWRTQGIASGAVVMGITESLREQAKETADIGLGWEGLRSNIDKASVSARQYNVNIYEVMKAQEGISKAVAGPGGLFGITGADVGKVLSSLSALGQGMTMGQKMFFGGKMGGKKGMGGLASWMFGKGASFEYNKQAGTVTPNIEGQTGRFVNREDIMKGRLASIMGETRTLMGKAAAGAPAGEGGTQAYLAATQFLEAAGISDEKLKNILISSNSIEEALRHPDMTEADKARLTGKKIEDEAYGATIKSMTLQEKLVHLQEIGYRIIGQGLNTIIALIAAGLAKAKVLKEGPAALALQESLRAMKLSGIEMVTVAEQYGLSMKTMMPAVEGIQFRTPKLSAKQFKSSTESAATEARESVTRQEELLKAGRISKEDFSRFGKEMIAYLREDRKAIETFPKYKLFINDIEARVQRVEKQ